MLQLCPITLEEANAYVAIHHRHHKPVRGHKFSVGVYNSETNQICGVIIVGRPVSRFIDDGKTLEVNRCCTDGYFNAASKLYGAAWRGTQALGYEQLVTYTLPSEGGASLRGAGWFLVGEKGGGTWNRPNTGRVRSDKHPLQKKFFWQARPPKENDTGDAATDKQGCIVQSISFKDAKALTKQLGGEPVTINHSLIFTVYTDGELVGMVGLRAAESTITNKGWLAIADVLLGSDSQAEKVLYSKSWAIAKALGYKQLEMHCPTSTTDKKRTTCLSNSSDAYIRPFVDINPNQLALW